MGLPKGYSQSLQQMAEAHRAQGGGGPGTHCGTGNNANADINYGALLNQRHCIFGVAFGFDDYPTAAANLEVLMNGVITFRIPVTTSGAGYFPVYRKTGKNQVMIVRLNAGGAGVNGYVSICNHWTEQG